MQYAQVHIALITKDNIDIEKIIDDNFYAVCVFPDSTRGLRFNSRSRRENRKVFPAHAGVWKPLPFETLGWGFHFLMG